MTRIQPLRRGFTLIELLITLVVLGVLVNVAIPSFAAFIDRSSTYSLALQIKSAIISARAEAIRSGGRVTLCASEQGTSCSGSLNDGLIVFADGDADSTVGTGEAIVQVVRHQDAQLSVQATDDDGNAVTAFGFNFRGFARAGVTIVLSRGAAGHEVQLSRAGRVTLI